MIWRWVEGKLFWIIRTYLTTLSLLGNFDVFGATRLRVERKACKADRAAPTNLFSEDLWNETAEIELLPILNAGLFQDVNGKSYCIEAKEMLLKWQIIQGSMWPYKNHAWIIPVKDRKHQKLRTTPANDYQCWYPQNLKSCAKCLEHWKQKNDEDRKRTCHLK